MKEVAVPAERIDGRLRELADLWATGWGEEGVEADSVLELLRIACNLWLPTETVVQLPLSDVPEGCLFQGSYRRVSGHRTIEDAAQHSAAAADATRRWLRHH